jgi:uncharacterized membrane protein YqjE
MSERPGAGTGLLDSGRRALDRLLQLAQLRLELLGTELEAEKLRLFDALLKAAIGLVLLGLAAVLALGFVILLLWDGYRLAAIGVLTLLLGGVGVWLLSRARAQLQADDGGPFALSLGELRRDRAPLQTPPGPDAAP